MNNGTFHVYHSPEIVCSSYAFVCNPMYSYITCILPYVIVCSRTLLVFSCMNSYVLVCYSYVLVCYSYVTRMYSYVLAWCFSHYHHSGVQLQLFVQLRYSHSVSVVSFVSSTVLGTHGTLAGGISGFPAVL